MTPDDLAKILDELGQRLGPTGEHVFALAVRQVYITAVVQTLAAVALGVIVVVGLFIFQRQRNAQWARWNALSESEHRYPSLNDRPGNIEVVIAFGLAALVVAFATLLLLDAIAAVLNPEYAAIRDILHAVTGGKS